MMPAGDVPRKGPVKVEMQVPILGQKPQVKVDPIQLFISGIGQILERLDQISMTLGRIAIVLEHPKSTAEDEQADIWSKEARIRKLADEEAK